MIVACAVPARTDATPAAARPAPGTGWHRLRAASQEGYPCHTFPVTQLAACVAPLALCACCCPAAGGAAQRGGVGAQGPAAPGAHSSGLQASGMPAGSDRPRACAGAASALRRCCWPHARACDVASCLSCRCCAHAHASLQHMCRGTALVTRTHTRLQRHGTSHAPPTGLPPAVCLPLPVPGRAHAARQHAGVCGAARRLSGGRRCARGVVARRVAHGGG